jgi:hypothetical protein
MRIAVLISAFFVLLLLLPSRGVIAQTPGGCFAGNRPTSADGFLFLCTQVYQLTGPCDGTDAVSRLKIIGTPPQTDWRIKTWEPQAIISRGVELAQSSGGTVEWAMAGNDSWPDIMLILAKGMTYGHAIFPSGTGMPMPSKSQATDKDYLDFHIVCNGDPFAFWYKIEYTIKLN